MLIFGDDDYYSYFHTDHGGGTPLDADADFDDDQDGPWGVPPA